MILKTKDDRITITQAANPSSLVFDPADWSVVNIPVDHEEATMLSRHLYNMPTSSHLSMLLTRHRRRDRLKALSNVSAWGSGNDLNWTFFDSVNITYEKPSSCSNNGLLPISESGLLVYKGAAPDASNTKWFNDTLANATNFWDVTVQKSEGSLYKNTYHQKFSWEVNLILKSLVTGNENRSFIYGLPVLPTEMISLWTFCTVHNLKVQLIAKNPNEARLMMSYLEGKI